MYLDKSASDARKLVLFLCDITQSLALRALRLSHRAASVQLLLGSRDRSSAINVKLVNHYPMLNKGSNSPGWAFADDTRGIRTHSGAKEAAVGSFWAFGAALASSETSSCGKSKEQDGEEAVAEDRLVHFVVLLSHGT